MKKIFILSALALVAFASCTKSQLVPVNEDQEITFQTAVGSISTKAAANSFPESAGFITRVFNHQNTVEVPENKLHGKAVWTGAGATEWYIDYANIKYDDSKWKATEKSYYWPKTSSLTFFAWSDGKSATPVLASANPVCEDAAVGFKVADYVIASDKNFNTDFMVSEVAYNQTSNTTNHGGSPAWDNGVPTIFHHQLSSFLFRARTDINYTGICDFYITSIKFKSVVNKGTYTQLVDNPATTSSWVPSEEAGDKQEYNMISVDANNGVDIPGTESVKGIKISETNAALSKLASDFEILLPQALVADSDPNDAIVDGTVLELKYYAVEEIGSTKVAKEYTSLVNLKSIYGASWEQEKKYTLDIVIKMDEILWDPAVEAWTEAVVNVEI